MIWRFCGRQMSFNKIRTVGILNVTPDSFSDGGEYFSEQKAVEQALKMEEAGADMIDIGGESTRPQAETISVEEELRRILPVLVGIRSKTQIPLSIDTTKPEVARVALEAGADILNDVNGLTAASVMADLAREFGAGLILMHRRGTPATMQSLTHYQDVVQDVFDELDSSFKEVVGRGVSPEQIVLDPGLGFAKTAEQNLELIRGLERFQAWNRPVLVGPSRKSFVGKLIDEEVPSQRDWGTAAAVALCVAYGAQWVRVHEVAAMRDVIQVTQAILEAGSRSYVRS